MSFFTSASSRPPFSQQKLSRILDNLAWLHDGQGLDEKTKARVLAQVEAAQ